MAVWATKPSPEIHSSTPSHQFRKFVMPLIVTSLRSGGGIALDAANLGLAQPGPDTPFHRWTPGIRAVDDVGMVLEHTEAADGASSNGSEPEVVSPETSPVPYAPSGPLRNPFPPIADYAF